MFPEAALQTAATASLPLQHVLAGKFVVRVSRLPDTGRGCLDANVSLREGFQAGGVANREAQGAEMGMRWLEDSALREVGVRIHRVLQELNFVLEYNDGMEEG